MSYTGTRDIQNLTWYQVKSDCSGPFDSSKCGLNQMTLWSLPTLVSNSIICIYYTGENSHKNYFNLESRSTCLSAFWKKDNLRVALKKAYCSYYRNHLIFQRRETTCKTERDKVGHIYLSLVTEKPLFSDCW